MGYLEVILIGISLAMDASAVSVCKGLSMKKNDWKKALIIALYFGGFQALMPLIGYFSGKAFYGLIQNIDHWIAFVLLAIIGISMIIESFKDEKDNINDKVDFKTMILLAIATSIDALAVGITFAFFEVNIIIVSLIIGIITFLISIISVKIGNVFGDKYGNKAEILGGIILILIAFKILLEHLNVF